MDLFYGWHLVILELNPLTFIIIIKIQQKNGTTTAHDAKLNSFQLVIKED